MFLWSGILQALQRCLFSLPGDHRKDKSRRLETQRVAQWAHPDPETLVRWSQGNAFLIHLSDGRLPRLDAAHHWFLSRLPDSAWNDSGFHHRPRTLLSSKGGSGAAPVHEPHHR